jgi:chromate transporter
VKAAVLAVVIEAVLRIGKRTLKNRTMVAIAALAFLGIFVFHIPCPLLILAAGIIGWIGSRIAPERFTAARHGAKGPDSHGIIDAMFARGELDHTIPRRGHIFRILTIWLPIWLGPVLLLWLLTGHASIWTQIGGFFSAMAVVTFGGAYAVLAYVAQAAVQSFAWLKPGEMVDGLGLAETTPGPLIMVLQFVGFLAAARAPGPLDPLLAGSLGALLTTWVTFAPCFLWIFLGAPYVEALRGNKAIAGALSAISAAVVGVVLNLAIWFGLHVIFRDIVPVHFGPASLDLPILSSINWPAAFLSACTMLAMLRFKTGMIPTLAASAVAGVVLAQVM